MASDLAAPQQQHLPHSDSMDTSSQDASYEAPLMNGDHAPTSDSMEQDELNISEAPAFSHPPATETAIDTKVTAPPLADPNPAGPTPVDDVASGIQPVADFIPKDASNLSHPTPPPDEPLGTGEADVDMDSPNADVTAEVRASTPPPVMSEPVSAQPSEPSLVRQREDDGDDEPAAKRSKVDEDVIEDVVAPVLSSAEVSAPLDQPEDQAATLISETVVEPSTEPSAAVTPAPLSEPVPAIPSAEESMVEPSSMDVEMGTTQAETQAETQSSLDLGTEPEVRSEVPTPVPPETQPHTQPSTLPESQPSDLAAVPAKPTEDAGPITASPTEDKPTDTAATTQTQPPVDTVASQEPPLKYSTTPMTNLQKTSLVDKVKNLKKTKHSAAFLKPVDYVALNIPTYPDIVKEPMDLSTLEQNLKDNKYGSVQDFANDFNLIISNVRKFNGDQHVVTQAGFNMQAYFNRMMQTVPGPDAVEAPKVQKKRSPSISREKQPRRESRMAAAPAAAPAPPAATTATTAPSETYALQPDGTPTIRRQSSNRPARAIKPPQNREIPYAKPKRKEHQLELRFCEHVLDEIRSPKHGQYNHVFLQPVDPVALNIPQYRQIIKQPMDLSTMSQKLKQGQYGTAAEFKKDFELIVKNCLTFNPVGNPVRDLGIQLGRVFETLWAEKDKWERKNQPQSNRASSASGDDDSDADEDEEEEEEENDDKAKIRALQKQLEEMQNALSGLGGDKASKPKKPKAKGSTSKKMGSISSAPKSKAHTKLAAKPKKPRQVTYDEKQEISESVGKMDEKQVQKLTEIITQNCAKYRDMEEMELEIDDLPNDVQVMLLDYVRKTFGNPNKKKARDPSPDDAAALDDDDFEPAERGGGKGSKRKKHRPMGKKEQQEAINKIQSKLAQFSQAATSGSESPTGSSFHAAGVKEETSGDEESEESEEE